MATHVDSPFLRIFLWEHFGSITPKATEFDPVIITDDMVDGKAKKTKSAPYMPRAWQLSGIKQAVDKTLVSVINREEEFTFRLYTHTPSTVVPLMRSKIGTSPLRCNDLEPMAVVIAVIVAPGLLPYKMEPDEGAVLYSL